MIKRLHTLFLLFFITATIFAQIPDGYYHDVEGKNKASLKTAFSTIIKSHIQRSYANLWTDFEQTDKRADGKVWDMYSTATFTFGVDQDKGSGSIEGEFYNREHSMPKSWFNDGYPMYTDLFHLYPTDKVVNNRRSNYPFGETNGENYKSNDGFSKLGNCTFPGYTGTVFEPNDEYKGDFARTYFYMATCYEDKISAWSGTEASKMLNQTPYPCFQNWALNLLLKWSRQDPVSEKERKRNEAVFKIQQNRNPYIDYPHLAEYVWGAMKESAFTYNTSPGTGVEQETIQTSVLVQNGGIYLVTPEVSTVYIFASDGSLLLTDNVVGSKTIEIDRKGIFIVKIVSKKNVSTLKITL